MTEQQEQQMLQALYDRLFQAITYAPDSTKSAPFPKESTLIQFASNQALNPVDFANPVSPINPNGDYRASEMFATMVDNLPAFQGDYVPSGAMLSKTYSNIVNGANTKLTIDPDQQNTYDLAYNYLNTTVEVKDFLGKVQKQTGPSQIYNTYNNNLTAYIAAVAAYRTAYLGYNLNNLDDQRKWQANEPLLANAVTQSYNTWRAQGATQVEQALAALATTINSSVKNAIVQAQDQVSAIKSLPSALGNKNNWFMAYALPSNWYDPQAPGFSKLTLSSSNLNTSQSSSSHGWNAGGSWSGGLWSVKAQTGGSTNSSNYHMDADQFTLTAEIAVVRVMRPWFNDLIFRMNGWYIDSRNKFGISNGQIEGNGGNMMPIFPTAFIVARNIQIQGNFSTQDQSHFDLSVNASTSVGWGPFQVSGSYSHSQSEDTFKSTFNNGVLSIPGIQVIGWVNQITPASAPLNSDGSGA
jgi:hypothetical protein